MPTVSAEEIGAWSKERGELRHSVDDLRTLVRELADALDLTAQTAGVSSNEFQRLVALVTRARTALGDE